jgi:hypothetical protein
MEFVRADVVVRKQQRRRVMATARNVGSIGSTGKRSARITAKGRTAATGVAKVGHKLKPVKKDSALNDKTERRDYPGGDTRR